MEYNRDPQTKPYHIWSSELQQRCQDHSMQERTVSSTNSAGKIKYTHEKNKV